MRHLRILTWHIHGSYLYYLSQVHHDLLLPVRPGRPAGYGGRSGSFPWPNNVHEIPFEEVKHTALDCVLFQSKQNYEIDQYEILSPSQRALPRIYLEHDPPRAHPTDTRHFADNPEVMLVHVTYFNALMWDSGRSPHRVIEHGVSVPEEARYTGELARGITVVNNIQQRGRRLGADIFERAKQEMPIDLVGMGALSAGGLGERSREELFALETRYRFFFNPIRYTSLGLAVCEAMMLGMPIIGFATTEMSSAVINGVSGFVETNESRVLDFAKGLLKDQGLARELGHGARRIARQRFSIGRFVRDWEDLLAEMTS